MLKTLLVLYLTLTINLLQAQTDENIIAAFKSINSNVAKVSCSAGKGNLISNRAMNIFLSNKVGTYLSGDDDLSLYKNSITFNTAEGTFTVSHNMRQAKGIDEPVKSFIFIGAKANVLNGIAAVVNSRNFINDFGLLVKKTWIRKPSTHFNKCTPAINSSAGHKQLMDALRASILHLIEAEIKDRVSVFKNSLSEIDSLEVPDQRMDEAKNNLQKQFYSGLQEEYSRKFAELQSETLIETNNYNLVTTHWTSISAYIPLLCEKFYVANSYLGDFKKEHLYPFAISLSHTRFLESRKYGRFFLKLNAQLFANNSYHSKALERINIADYKARGGTDTLHLSQQNSNEVYVGRYNNFFTRQLNAAFVYIPPNSHFGLSSSIEQNFGRYKALNGKIGLPIVLIDKKGDPDITFEFQVRFFDINKKVQPAIKLSDKTSIGFSIGVPFSKIVY